MNPRLAAALLAMSISACGGGTHAVVSSPCRGIDPWTGAALRRCMALVSRWAPAHSVPLTTHITPRVSSTCEQARRAVRMPVVCPPLVPTGGVVADPGLYGFEGGAGDFYLLTFNNGENRGHVHWLAGAGLGKTVQRNLFNPRVWDVPGRIRRVSERRYGPWTITFFRFPPHPSGGELGGHDLALAKVGGTTYFATVHGYTHHDADAAMLIAILLTAPSLR